MPPVSALTKATPAGRRSWAFTPVASAEPVLPTDMEYVNVWPITAVSASTTLDCVSRGMPGTVVEAHEESWSGLGQGLSTTSGGGSGGSTTWKAFTSVEPAAWGSTLAVTVSVAVVPAAIVPTFQAPVAASKVPDPFVFALT